MHLEDHVQVSVWAVTVYRFLLTSAAAATGGSSGKWVNLEVEDVSDFSKQAYGELRHHAAVGKVGHCASFLFRSAVRLMPHHMLRGSLGQKSPDAERRWIYYSQMREDDS